MQPVELQRPGGPFPVPAVIDSCVMPRVKRWLAPIVDRAADGYVQPLWSPLIISETNRLLTWTWIKRHGGKMTDASWRQCSADAKRWFARMTRVFRVVEDCPPAAPLWTDPPADEWDTPLWTAAVRGKAAFIVTANLDDGPPPGSDGIREYAGVFLVHPDVFLAFVDELVDQYYSAAAHEQPVADARGLAPELPSYREILAPLLQGLRR